MTRFRLSALSRATHLHRAGLAAALLLPFCTELHAYSMPEQQPVTQEQAALTGHFLNLKAMNSKARSGGDIATDQLRQQTGLSIHSVAPSEADKYEDLQVLVGKTMSRNRTQQAEDDIVIASRPDGSFVALLPQANAIIRGTEDGQQTLLRFDGSMPGEHTNDSVDESELSQPNQIESRAGQLSYQLDRNNAGEIVIDLLAGFSDKSAEYIGDPEAFSLTQVAAVNQAIKNSQIQGVRLRLVGIQVIRDDMPITTTSLKQVKDMFAEGIKQYSPDLVASFVRGGSGQDTAVGWGNVNGRYTINQISSPVAFRHELGHNVGGNHCSDGSSYRFGHNNGRVKTILCGNQIPYYSNPDLADSQGIPLGNAKTANMARLWRERAAKMSAHAPAVVPLADEYATLLVQESVDLTKNGTHYFPLDIPAGTQRLLFTAVPGPKYETSSKLQLLLKHGSQPSSNDYDYRSTPDRFANLTVNNPPAGRWYLGLKGDADKNVIGLAVEGQAFALKNETVKARYVRLVANSSVDGNPNASIAELYLADAHGKSLPRNWQINSASSTLSGSSANNILDGNPKSYWASASGASYPHQLVLDLSKETSFSQLHYLPRQDQGMSGNIKAYQVYGGAATNGPWTLLSSGEFSADNEVKSVALKPYESVLPPVAVISGATVANAGQKILLDASASSDPKGYALDFAWKASPSVDFSIDGPQLSFVAPKLGNDTLYRFTLKLSNGKQTSTAIHEVLVKASATATSCKPQWDVNKSYSENDEVQHKGRQYMARWWVKGSEPGNPTVTGADGSGKVWKDLGPCDNGSVAVKPPVASISGVSQAKTGEQVTLNASGSSDPAGLPLEYRWSVSPSLSYQASGPKLTFTAPKVAQDTSYRFKLELSNGQQSVFKEHNVKVTASASVQPTSCQGPWSTKTSYQAGSKVSHKGHFYTARWWTQGNEPGNPAFTGPEGSGKVWNDDGPCK